MIVNIYLVCIPIPILECFGNVSIPYNDLLVDPAFEVVEGFDYRTGLRFELSTEMGCTVCNLHQTRKGKVSQQKTK